MHQHCIETRGGIGTASSRLRGSADCHRPVAMAHLPNRAATCYICRQGFEEHHSFYEFPEGRVHSTATCKEAYYEKTSEKCLSCGKGLLPGTSHYHTEEGKVHAGECYDKFCRGRAPKCCVCKSPLLARSHVYLHATGGGEAVCAEGECHSNILGGEIC